MSWRHIVIEGICLGDRDLHGNPCGRPVGVHCLDNGHCPWLGYTESSEREAVVFVPIHLFCWDKLKCFLEETKWKLRWWLWGKWHYDPSWIDSIPVAECPEWDRVLDDAIRKFPEWIKQVREGDEESS
ncbi:MAG: hypothetical protein JRD89_20390 [Deltaproteobacteria bacterium]|nr:hypothetical protein [Deltaproteobacteria bacterium]